MKLKRSSTAGEYETLAEMDSDMFNSSHSPSRTPSSLSPPLDAADSAVVVPMAGKKRKSLSDGEDAGSPPIKRPYQSHTLPRLKSSPRKSLPSIAGSPACENTPPPLPAFSQSLNGLHPKLAPATSAPDRALLTPLSSNDLNGTLRPLLAAAPAGGFTPVNNFPPVNTSPPGRESAPQPNGQSYASPYDGKGNGLPAPTQNLHNPPKAPPLNTSVSHGFQAVNSPVVGHETNGVSARNSPASSSHHHAAHHQHQLHPSHPPPPPPPPPPGQMGSTSRANTPVHHHHHHHHHHRPALAQQRSSRSNTPIAPAQTIQPAPNASVQPTSVPAVQTATATHPQPGSAPRPFHAGSPLAPHTSSPMHYAPPVQAVLKSHPAETAPAVQHASAGVHDLSLLQCEILGLLMQYFFPKSSSPLDEASLLYKTESLWQYGTAHFHKQIGPLFDLQTKVLFSWIAERRMLAQLRQAIALRPGVSAAEMVERLIAMNDLRVMRLKWKNMSSADGLSAEDLLCRTFAVMTNTEGTEYLFKDGLDRLNESVLEYLRSEDLKILLKQG